MKVKYKLLLTKNEHELILGALQLAMHNLNQEGSNKSKKAAFMYQEIQYKFNESLDIIQNIEQSLSYDLGMTRTVDRKGVF